MRVPNDVVQAADNMAKETHLSFRDCLDIIMRTYLSGLQHELSPVKDSATAVSVS